MDLPGVTSYRSAAGRGDLALAPGETLVSGGTWLFSEPQPGTTGLVDLTGLDWPAWERTAEGLRLAATCTVEELLAIPAGELGTAADLVRFCADALVMSFKVQHLATLGGNVCLALPAGAMTSLLVALDATAVVWTPEGGERRQPVADLVTGVCRTTLEHGEVLRALEVPASSFAETYAFRRASLAPLGRSAVLLVARRTPADVVLSLTAATTRPVLVELYPHDWPYQLPRALDAVDCWHQDAHGAADWRAAMAGRLAAECLEEVRR
jgi:CO/xanthine dehydrogenase FAD-binding subunit